MEKQVVMMNQYVADLAVLNVKFHNLHWNVIGERFEQVHVHLEAIYDDLFVKFDEVAERIKMLGEFPKASIREYLEISKVEELNDEDVTIKKVFEIVKAEIAYLKTLSTAIRKEADGNDDFVTVGLMEDHIAAYDKELYFVNQAMK
ncbi:MAG: Dps family protein [Candidatus Izemoplasmataceae bacterium]